jgi:uncharacterized membrane protein YkoI
LPVAVQRVRTVDLSFEGLGEVDLEYSQGNLAFNVDIGDKDVKVDASNGSILSVDADD